MGVCNEERVMDKAQKKAMLEAQGHAIGKVWGGPTKKKYYTPDGRVIFATPSEREYVIRDADGNVIEQGIRDANYDKGWRETPPSESERKLYCKYCDRWHDTEKEIEECGISRKKLETWGLQQARKLHPKDFEKYDKIMALEERVDNIDAKLDKIIAALGGKDA